MYPEIVPEQAAEARDLLAWRCVPFSGQSLFGYLAQFKLEMIQI
jgi:hypothetical protein